jgi:hypothetical protein
MSSWQGRRARRRRTRERVGSRSQAKVVTNPEMIPMGRRARRMALAPFRGTDLSL